ncbi:hypothetical protein B9Z55_012336 [Caenorhabditis nigoni]|uniref:Sdz-33 F-box domain-containing protein n=2 Tax=Caenorhabditis nigoni TaxID=1611254 RepID=A0A2G5TWT9_9PELO|nr:hypothetical protein B9Z55_012336 [Caenorhabditis nigoni]
MGPKVYHFLFLKDNGNVIEEIKLMIEHICEVFRSPITGITIVEESLIDWIIKFQPTIRYVWINDDVVNSVGTLDRIFENLNVTNHFRLKSIGNEPIMTDPIPFPSISIYNFYWFDLPSILNGTNAIIRLYRSILTTIDINTILKEWQLGYYLYNLEYLEIETFTFLERYDFILEVLKNLDWTPNFGNEGRPTTVKVNDEHICTVPREDSRFNIIRFDGMVGSMFFRMRNDGGNRKMIFMFQVWRKQA